jgi:hypothetical protein
MENDYLERLCSLSDFLGAEVRFASQPADGCA